MEINKIVFKEVGTPEERRLIEEARKKRADRAFRNRGVKYGESVKVIWQIKNKLNIGRY